MPTLPNTGMNSPNNGDNLGTWDQPLRQNWEILDALFSGLPATSVGGTGHVHNGTPGQGPRLDHTGLTSIGAKTHPMLESDITGIDNRLTFVETTYCADVLCGGSGGSGGGGIGSANQPPVHYTDNFTTSRGTRLGTNDWLVSSDSAIDWFETTGRSAFMVIDPLLLGTPVVDRYAAVVHAQIPHSMAQRCTFAITRFTADRMQNDDTLMLVMALVSTNTLGAATPFIHFCGIKFVLVLSNNGGIFTITRQAVIEMTDGLFQVVQQDAITGLTYTQAEAYVRGIHEFSISKDGGLWYYVSRMPVWIMPPGTVSQFYGPLQATLLGLGEPPFGSIGFGYSWNIKPSTVIDVEMSWFTMDSDDNVEVPYPTPDFPPNWPRPYDPEPPELCCGGVGPGIGTLFDVYGDGTRMEKVISKVGETAIKLESGLVIPCGLITLDPLFTPADNAEGSLGSISIPTTNSPPSEALIVTPSGTGLTVTDVDVNDAGKIITIQYELAEYSDGDSFGFNIAAAYDLADAIVIPVAVNAINATPEIVGVVWTDLLGTPISAPPEGQIAFADIYTKNDDLAIAGPPFPCSPGADLTFSGSGFSVLYKWYMGPGHYRAKLDFDDATDGDTFGIIVTNHNGGADTSTQTIGMTAPVPLWAIPQPGSYAVPGVTITEIHGFNFRDGTFANPTLVTVAPPHGPFTITGYTGSTVITGNLTLMDMGGGVSGPVMFTLYHDGTSHASAVTELVYWPDPTLPGLSVITGQPTDPPIDGTYTTLKMAGVNLPEAQVQLELEFDTLPTPTPIEPNRWRNISFPSPTIGYVELDIPNGYAGIGIRATLTKPGSPAVSAVSSPIAVEPTPNSTDTWSGGTYPGATGTLQINDPGGINSYLVGVALYASAGATRIQLGATTRVDGNNLTAAYAIPETVTPGDAINVSITNPLGALHTFTTQNVADLPVHILKVVWEDQVPMEGRSSVTGKIYCENLDAGAVATIISGATLVSYTVVGQTVDIVVSMGTLTGGTQFVVRIDNPTPVPSSVSVAVDILTEPDPYVGVYITPPTPGAARTIRLVGNNLYPADAYSAGIVPALTLTTNLTWDPARQTKGEWQGVVDIIGIPGQAIDLSMTRPSGRTFSRTGVFTILPLDLIPSGISAVPNTLQSARLVTVEIAGTSLGSVQSVDLECEQPTRQPVGSSARVPCTITGATASLIRMQCVVPTGNISLSYKAIFYNRFLDPLKTESGLFTVVKSSTGPAILNKAVLWSIINTTQLTGQTITVSLDPSTPITDKNTEIVGTNIAIASITDISPGGAPGTVFDITFTNGYTGQEAELAFFNKQVVPEEKDVLRWAITT